ncbi:hypothetical protein AB4Y43_16925 [Paraburkholderia sp. BR10872]|uniref:hypothetical protein n=1 Tax=Paraburkholderia sp. BR10872 TaxID=3236989 RepID=UPI0034D22B90
MKSLQRLEQHLLATDTLFDDGNVALTQRAQRLRTAFRRGVAVGVTAAAAFTAAGTGLYMKTGPGSFDPQRIFSAGPVSSQRMAQIYDTHRKLAGAHERIREIKSDMIQGETSGPVSLTLEQQVAQLRAARAEAAHITQEFSQETHGLTPEQIHRIVGDDDTQGEVQLAQATATEEADDAPRRAPRFRP